MAAKTPAKLVAEMLAAAQLEFEAKRNANCMLCKLDKEKAEALEMIMQAKKDTKRPTFNQAAKMMQSIGVNCSDTTFRNHMADHWNGEEKR